MIPETWQAINDTINQPEPIEKTEQLTFEISLLLGNIDKNRWAIGDRAIQAKEAGMSIREIAMHEDIRRPRSTIDNYYQQASFYDKSTRDYLAGYEGMNYTILNRVHRS